MPKGIRVLSKVYWGYGGRLFPRPGGVGKSPGQLVVGGLPLAFLSLGVVSRIRSPREKSLRTSGCVYGGSAQIAKAALSSTVWMLAGGYSCTTVAGISNNVLSQS